MSSSRLPPASVERAEWLEEELAGIPEIPREAPCLDLGSSRPLGALDEPEGYELPYVSRRLRRKGDSAIDEDLNAPWD